MAEKYKQMNNNNHGIALVVVLWIAVILSSIVISSAYLVRLETRQSGYALKEIQASGAALSVIEKVKAALILDNSSYNSLKGKWKALSGKSGTIGDFETYILLEDEESKFDLNAGEITKLQRIPQISRYINFSLTSEYLKKKRFCCIEDFIFLNEITDESVNKMIRSLTTICSGGVININTAPVETLLSLPSVDYNMAQAIIARRNGRDLTQGTKDDIPYTAIENVKAVTGAKIYDKIKNYLTITSLHYKLTINLNSGKYMKTVEAMLLKENNNIKVLYWKET